MVNLLPAVLVGGPPHAGKSVLFYHLTQALRARNIPHHAIRACPDGEGNWFHEGHLATVSDIRVKISSEWPPSFVERICHDMEYHHLPLLVDMGGRPKASQLCLFHFCTHSILLQRHDRPDDAQHWQQIVEQHNILTLAHIYSAQNGESTISDLFPILQGTFNGLERGQPRLEHDLLLNELVARVANLFQSYALDDLKTSAFAHSATELTLDLDLALKTFTTTSHNWQPAMLQPYLESIPKRAPISIYGAGPNWLYAALAAHAYPQPFYLFDPKLLSGWVQPVPVVTGTVGSSSELCIETGANEELTILKISIPSRRIEYLQPDALTFPPVATEKGLIIDGPIPNWLLTALTRLYREVGVAWIAPFYVPSDQAVVAYSRIAIYHPGDLIPRPSLELQHI